MRRWLLAALFVCPGCNFSNDYSVFCGNTGRCGVTLRGATCVNVSGDGGVGTTPVSVSLPGVDGGDLLVVTIDRFVDPTGSLVSVTDSLGSSFQPAFAGQEFDPFWTQTFFAQAAATGPDQITATFSTQQYTDLFATAFGSLPPGAKVDQSSHANGPSGSPDPGALTTTVPDETLYATAISDTSVTQVAGGFEMLSSCNGNMIAWRTGGPLGAYDPLFTSSGGAFLTTVASFR